MHKCPLKPEMTFEGRCPQKSCPYNTSLTSQETGCWHGAAEVNLANFVKFKQLDENRAKLFKTWYSGLCEDIKRLELIRQYRSELQEEVPTQQDEVLWKEYSVKPPYSYPELGMNLRAFASMNREDNFESFKRNRKSMNPETTLNEFLFDDFNSISQKEKQHG